MKKITNTLKTTESYLEEVKTKFGDKFDYSLIEYKSAKDYVTIICKEHGEFKQEASYFVNASKGCPKCSRLALSSTAASNTVEFITKAKLIHGNLFDYSQVDYIRSNKKVKIICPTHGVFEQTPNNHLRNRGCDQCRGSKFTSKAEEDLCSFIKNYGLNVVTNTRHTWLNNKELDIYIPSLNLAIEYNGFAYHHSSNNISPFLDGTSVSTSYHLQKYNLCKENGINLIHIFEFEDLNEWKEKLENYFSSPNNFSIHFENFSREITMYNKTLVFYGTSNIIRTN